MDGHRIDPLDIPTESWSECNKKSLCSPLGVDRFILNCGEVSQGLAPKQESVVGSIKDVPLVLQSLHLKCVGVALAGGCSPLCGRFILNCVGVSQGQDHTWGSA